MKSFTYVRYRRARRRGVVLLLALCALTPWLAGTSSEPNRQATNSAPAAQHDRGTLFLTYAEHLKPAAEAWAAYRAADGWRVVMHAVAPGADDDVRRVDLQRAIRSNYQLALPHDPSRFAVLLLGDADEQGIPVWRVPQTDPVLQSRHDNEYITDHPYQLLNDSDIAPVFALGRIPAQTVDEALQVLEKIKRYEADFTPGPWRHRITYAAGEGRFGAMDSLLESLFKTMVDRMVPDAFDLTMTYAKASSLYCPPPSQLTETILNRLTEGALLFNYIGHGFERGFDALHWQNQRFEMLHAKDLDRLSNHADDIAQLPIAFLSCCSAGWFDLPNGAHSLAEAMLFQRNGPVAVIAGSRITHPYANTVLQKDITKALLADRAPTVGMLDLLATQAMLQIDEDDRELDAIAAPIAWAGRWKTGLMDLRRMHAGLYNLLGDPATRIQMPEQSISDLQLADSTLTGRIAGMARGLVHLTIETPRVGFAHADRLQPPTGANDPELERKAANNYPLANDRVLQRAQAEVIDGRFELALDAPLPTNAAVLRLYAAGRNESGQTIDAIGALELMKKEQGESAPLAQRAQHAPSTQQTELTESAQE